jgi:hypothetical protein
MTKEQKACRFLIEPTLTRRPGNVIAVEIGSPQTRCSAKPPEHWPKTPPSGNPKLGYVLRWLGSGGSPLVFGCCTPNACPVKEEEQNDNEEATG